MGKKRTPEATRQVEQINLAVGQHMEAAMKERGENFNTLAEKAGMARPVVWRLMKGKRRANVEQIARIAKALNMDAGDLVPSELFSGEDVPKKSGTAARTKTTHQTDDRGNTQQGGDGNQEAPAFGLALEEYLRRDGHELTTEERRMVTGWYKVAQGAVIDEQVIKDFLKAWRAHNERVAKWMAEGGGGRK
jgi:transcriptional regulator with XRE-family HTH domain